MRMRKVSILCVQETRWRGKRAKELGNGYKLCYSSTIAEGRNGDGVVELKDMKEHVFKVRRGHQLIMARLVCGGGILNVVSAYEPQTGSTQEKKNEFWRKLEDEMETFAVEKRVMLGADLNGNVGAGNEGCERIHGGHDFGNVNADGE